MSAYALNVEALSAAYGNNVVFENVSFDVGTHEVIAIMGPSGSGKSTLLKVLSGLHAARVGRFSLNDRAEDSATMMFQSPLLQPWLTVQDNVSLPARLQGRECDVSELLAGVGLAGYESRYPYELSGGEQRRISLARALSVPPGLLLLDEPFTGVDELTREKLFQLLARVLEQRHLPCVLVTHNPYESVYLADRVLFLQGSPTSLIGDIKIPLPRPRNRKVMESVEFAELVAEVRATILNGGG